MNMEKKRILAVDDNAVNLAAIERALRDDYEVLPMIAAARALKYLRGNTADLILLDVLMPGMDGVEALRQLRQMENGAQAPVIFLSGTRDESAAAEGARLGVLDYIIKPFDENELKQRIAKVFESDS